VLLRSFVERVAAEAKVPVAYRWSDGWKGASERTFDFARTRGGRRRRIRRRPCARGKRARSRGKKWIKSLGARTSKLPLAAMASSSFQGDDDDDVGAGGE